jgi:hypothetical protein
MSKDKEIEEDEDPDIFSEELIGEWNKKFDAWYALYEDHDRQGLID